jgi:uncharacterized SAM-binding protein YcdF (DUF218 family)
MTLLWGALWRVTIVAAGCGLLWLAGLLWFVNPPATDTRAAPTDAIVVLTGGSLRLQSGFELLREGKGRVLFVSGVNPEVALDDVLRISGNAPDWALCCVTLGHQAENTLGNADETARWIRSRGLHSLRLVTAWYHMPRSRLEFSRVMPEIEIVAHPVFPEQVKQQHWWAWRGSGVLLVSEYVKYLAAVSRPLWGWLELARAGKPESTHAELRR